MPKIINFEPLYLKKGRPVQEREETPYVEWGEEELREGPGEKVPVPAELAEAKVPARTPCDEKVGIVFAPKARAFGARGAPSAASPQSTYAFSTACRYDVWLSRTRPLKLGQNAVARARAAGAAAGGARHHDDRQRAVGRPGAGATAPPAAPRRWRLTSGHARSSKSENKPKNTARG